MRLRCAATFLRKIGIEVDHKREGDRARTRLIRITSASSDSAPEKAGTQTSETSASSASIRKANAANGFASSDLWTVNNDSDDTSNTSLGNVRDKTMKNKGADDVDDADAKKQLESAPEKQAGGTDKDWQAHFDERAGIAEFDGGLSRVEAEAQALHRFC
jgi:hypothetical protein